MTRAAGELLILAKGGTWEDRFQVTSLAASAVAAGKSVDVALFFGALHAWVNGDWSRLDPAPPVDADRLRSLAMPPLEEVLAGARDGGMMGLYACSASVRILGLDAAAVQERVDVILGWQSFSRMIEAADRVVSF